MTHSRGALATLCGAASLAAAGCFSPVVQTFQNQLSVPVRVVDGQGNVIDEFAPGKEILIRQNCPADHSFEVLATDGDWIPAVQSGEHITCFGVTCCIDNRAHDAVSLQIGSVIIELPANSYGQYDFPAPRASANAQVKLDGVAVGELPSFEVDGIDETTSVTCLIDTSGQRAYRWERVAYGDAFAMGGSLNPIYFAGEHFYRLDYGVNYFLEEIPEEIEGYADFESRAYLVEEKPDAAGGP